MAGSYMKCNSGLNWVYFEICVTNVHLKLTCHTDGVIRSRNFEKKNYVTSHRSYLAYSNYSRVPISLFRFGIDYY